MARTAQKRKINYTVLLDEKNDAGARFNGGELPTTVIVDAEGNVRRRFIGTRSLPVFEAMIAEAVGLRIESGKAVFAQVIHLPSLSHSAPSIEYHC